jgi:Sulfotransferase domain
VAAGYGLGLRRAAGRSPEGVLAPASREAVNPENMVWIFGAGRSGSTWLASMMGELEGHHVWFEPWVGALFDPDHLRLEERKGRHFILSPHYKKTWLRSIRNFVLDGANVRFPEMTEREYLVAKEPGGSVGAVLLAEALPESRMVLLVRDPRDYTASWLDAHKEGGWQSSGEGSEDSTERTAKLARRYLHHVGNAKEAYDAHAGRKALVRYEDLRADALGAMKRLYSELGIPVDEGELARAVEKHAWENIPEEDKGEGKFYRKGRSGGWKEDLTEEQVRTVERITSSLLDEFYPEEQT